MHCLFFPCIYLIKGWVLNLEDTYNESAMFVLRPSNERGHANHGWLDSYHTFSFAGYYDPKHMGVSSLRVINDDHVAPGAGFPAHGHQDMEIISYVKQGTIEHKDSMGNVKTLPAGEFQLMSAGTGVTHSEYNPSKDRPLNFLQIWITPDINGIEPGYQQKQFPAGPMQLVVSPDGREGSLRIHQDAYLYHIVLSKNESAQLSDISGRTIYIHVISGILSVEGKELSEGDGATISNVNDLALSGQNSTEALLFSLP